MTNPLRCADDPQHYDHGLRERVAAAIRAYPNDGAPWWTAPEAVLRAVEEHLGIAPEED